MNYVEEASSDDELDDESYVGAVHNRHDDEDEWYETFQVYDKALTFQLDTGAKCNAISSKTFSGLGVKSALEQSSVRLRSSFEDFRLNYFAKVIYFTKVQQIGSSFKL